MGVNDKASPPGRHQERAPKQRCTFSPTTFSSVQFSSSCGSRHSQPTHKPALKPPHADRVAFCACTCAVCAVLRQKDTQKCCCAADHVYVPACRRQHTRPRRSDVAILTQTFILCRCRFKTQSLFGIMHKLEKFEHFI